MLPVYIINLDRRPDRWTAIFARCGCLGIEVTRISAVDVRELAVKPAGYRDLEIGAAAIVLSHCKALQMFMESSHPAALILEDDVELSSDLPTVLQSTDWWPSESRVLKLEGSTKSRYLGRSIGLTPSGRHLHPIQWASAYAGAYLIDRTGAQIVLDGAPKTSMTTDSMLFHVIGSSIARKLNPAHIVPAMAYQIEDFGSDNIATKSPREINRHRRLFAKIKVLILHMAGLVKKFPIYYMDKY